MNRRAFTLVEVFVCVAILAVVGAICTPVLTRSRDQARVTAAVENLRQLSLAFNIYRQQWDGASTGSAEEMGLPGLDLSGLAKDSAYVRLVRASSEGGRSPCGLHPSTSPEFKNAITFNYHPFDADQWRIAVDRHGDGVWLFADANCDDASDANNPFDTHRIIFSTLAGNAVVRRTDGRWYKKHIP